MDFQNALLENYAQLKELELRAGVPHTDDSLGEVRIISVSNWPAHDLLLLVRDDLELPLHSEISGIFGKLSKCDQKRSNIFFLVFK